VGERLRLGLIGGLGLRGKELRRALEASPLPVQELTLLDRKENAGTLADFGGEPLVVREATAAEVTEIDVALGCDGALLLPLVEPLAAAGARVVDLSGALPLDAQTGLCGPWPPLAGESRLRRHRLAGTAAIFAGSVLAALAEAAPALSVDLVLLEPAAALGDSGIAELEQQTRDLLAFQTPAPGVIGGRLAFNVLPAAAAEQQAAEHRLREELRHLLGDAAPQASFRSLHVPVFLGVAACIDLELEDEHDPRLLAEVLGESPALRLQSDGVAPGVLPEDDNTIHVQLMASANPARLRLWAAMDHERRGAVSNVVELLERMALGRG
jgi:aspartate-semialdehyde dehydrogenase